MLPPGYQFVLIFQFFLCGYLRTEPYVILLSYTLVRQFFLILNLLIEF
jgi:hypothetical protein